MHQTERAEYRKVFKKIFILMWTIFKVFIEFVTIPLLLYVLVYWPQDQRWNPHPPALEGRVSAAGPVGKSLECRRLISKVLLENPVCFWDKTVGRARGREGGK